MKHLDVSRRAVTRALVTLPMIAVPTLACATGVAGSTGEPAMNMHATFISATASRAAWDAARARYEAARAAERAFDDAVWIPAKAARKAKFGEDHWLPLGHAGRPEIEAWEKVNGFEKIYARLEEIGDALADTQVALLETPAPDLVALRWKLENTIEPGDEGDIAQWCDDIRLAIVADYQRLLPLEA